MAYDAQHHRSGRSWSRRSKIVAAIVGALMVCATAVGVSNWVVGVDPGSSGEAQSATISNLTITATSSPAATNLLYPGGTGDVVVTIGNPNPFPVTLTAVNLPTNTTYAAGFSNSSLATPIAGCAAATPSLVTWSFATGSSGTSHTLTTALVVAANGQTGNPLVVTFTSDASMGLSTPLACAGAYFSMPSFTGVSATGGATGSATSSPATDAWTS